MWGRPDRFFHTGTVRLLLTFDRPSRCQVLLQFDIKKYGGLVDNIILRQGLYIQPGRPVTGCARPMAIRAFLRKCPLVSSSLNGTTCFGRRYANCSGRSTG